jgi:hypothetical protein
LQAPHSFGFLLKTLAIDWVFSGLAGWHAGGVYAGGFHGPAVVNHYYGGGCWNCGAAAIAGAAIGAAAVGLAVGSLVATVPAGCPYQVVGAPITMSATAPGTSTIMAIMAFITALFRRFDKAATPWEPAG